MNYLKTFRPATRGLPLALQHTRIIVHVRAWRIISQLPRL